MKYTVYSVAIILLALALAVDLSQTAPIDGNNIYQAVSSPVDISGQAVRQKRAKDDYFICYPSSVVYGYHSSPNDLVPHRRSDETAPRYPGYDSYQALTDRADRERAIYRSTIGGGYP